MDKFSNEAIIGNQNIVASYTKTGELQRFCYPAIDGRQFIDFFHVGLKINDSNIIYLHDDVNNVFSQSYVEDSNILTTETVNKYFNIDIEQTDFVTIDENILVKKYVFTNNNSIDLDLNFIVHSKILSNELEGYASKIFENGIIQYNHNYTFSIFSKSPLYGHRLNDVGNYIGEAILEDKDYIGMSNEVGISYNLGNLKSGKKTTFYLYICAMENSSNVESKLVGYTKIEDEKELSNTRKYWKKYLSEHSSLKLSKSGSEFNQKILEIYNRTILLYPLLINYKTGGIAAALEVDDNRHRSGGYRYCWTRDAVFITKAFDLLNMKEDTDRFFNTFCKNTQSESGMWEQRFFTDGRLAPCWGYQIDETASVIYGVCSHYEYTGDREFLQKNLKMCEKATKFLIEYVNNIVGIDDDDLVRKELKEKYKKTFNFDKHISYDLWEMNEGVHLYSLSAIIAGFESMKKIYEVLSDNSEKVSRLKIEKQNKIINELNRYTALLKDYIDTNLIDSKQKIFKRNLKDNKMDISTMGIVYPFNIYEANNKTVTNTVDKINMTLKTYNNGYLRFEGDNYMKGENQWVITTLWMALYYIKLGKISEAEKCFKFVVNTASEHGFLSEQVNSKNPEVQWVTGLGWSHAMFIIVLHEILKNKK